MTIFNDFIGYTQFLILKWRYPKVVETIKIFFDLFHALKLDEIISQETLLSIQEQVCKDIYSIANSKDSRMKCRESLTELIREFTRCEVLLMDKDNKNDLTGFAATQGVTGELYKYLTKIASHNKWLNEMAYEAHDEPTSDDILALLGIMRARNYWLMETYNHLRKTLGDYYDEDNEDWYGPYIHAMCVCAEYQFRMDAGLKTNIDITVFMMYATFETFVEKGRQFPDQAWRNSFRDSIEDGTLTPPFSNTI